MILCTVSKCSIHDIGRIELRHGYIALIVFVLQALARWQSTTRQGATSEVALMVWGISAAVLVWVVSRNAHLPGAGLIGVGLMSNAFVVLLNGAMPVVRFHTQSHHAAVGFYREADVATILVWMGDVLPDPTGLWLMSVGDVLLILGVAVVLASSGGHMTMSRRIPTG